MELVSDAPVRFIFKAGYKDSQQVTDHPQLLAIVKEFATPHFAAELKSRGGAELTHLTVDGNEVILQVEMQSPTQWQLIVISTAPEIPAASPEEFLEAPLEAVMPSQAEVSLPKASPAKVEPSKGMPFRAEPIPISPAIAESNLKVETPKEPAAAALKPAAPLKIEVESGQDTVGTKASLVPMVSDIPPLGADEPEINRYLRMMIKQGASDLHLSSNVAPMVRLHGEMKRLEQRDAFRHEELFALLRQIMPERNVTEFEETHDTDFAHSIEGLARFRVNVFMDRKGVGTVIRQIPFEILSPEQLGLPKQVLDLCWLSKGLVVVTGPTGSGKSTTLATLVDFINQNRSDHIITIEDPIEFVHPNKKCLVNQREISTHTNSFKRALRAALREDPDIVLVGEMRDLETISIAIETAETGHLVFGTLHTTTAPSTVDRIIDQFPPEQQSQIRVMLSESLKGVIAQVLCRKKGKGRVAAYEILIGTSAIANLIREGKTFQIPSAMQTGRNLGMRLMNDHLLELVMKGQVDVEEAYIKSADKHNFKTLLSQNNIPFNK